MTMDFKTISVAALAGIACVLLVSAAIHAGPSGILLFVLAPFPIYAAAFAWGTNAAVFSSVTAIVTSAAVVSPEVAISLGLTVSLPASIVGHQANLAQQGPDGKLIWYPLPQLYLSMCLAVAIGIIGMLVYHGYDNVKADLMPHISEWVNEMIAGNEMFAQFPQDQIEPLKLKFLEFIPFAISSVWILIHVFNAYIASWVCRLSGLMPRPADDLPANVSLPAIAIGILIASFILAFLFDGKIGYYTFPILGVFLSAFSLLGLANLHLQARIHSGFIILLMISYFLIISLQFPLFLFAFSGVRRAYNAYRNARSSTGPTSSND